jgi:hypothetical protein
MQHITRAGCLGTGLSVKNKRQYPVGIGGASGAIPLTATTRPCRGSTQQQETLPVETVSQARIGTTKTGKPRQRTTYALEQRNEYIYHAPILYDHQIVPANY